MRLRDAFFSVARDTCGNVEAAPPLAQDTVLVLAAPGAPRLALALEGAVPNPARGRWRVAFTLASAERASLELIDVQGRRVTRREVGSLGAGRHLVTFDSPRLRPGLYFLRLAQGRAARIARLVALR